MSNPCGLFLVGRFVSDTQATYGDGTPVEGLRRIKVDISASGGPLSRDASYNTHDINTGEATPVAQQVASLQLAQGDLVKLRVGTRTKGNSSFVNLDCVTIEKADAPAASVRKAS